MICGVVVANSGCHVIDDSASPVSSEIGVYPECYVVREDVGSVVKKYTRADRLTHDLGMSLHVSDTEENTLLRDKKAMMLRHMFGSPPTQSG